MRAPLESAGFEVVGSAVPSVLSEHCVSLWFSTLAVVEEGALGSERATLTEEAFHSGETAGRRHMGRECGLFTEPLRRRRTLSTRLAV